MAAAPGEMDALNVSSHVSGDGTPFSLAEVASFTRRAKVSLTPGSRDSSHAELVSPLGLVDVSEKVSPLRLADRSGPTGTKKSHR